MLSTKALLATITLALSSVVHGAPVNDTATSLALTRRVNITSGHGLVQTSQARAKQFAKGPEALGERPPPPSVPATNDWVIYLVQAYVGPGVNPPYQLLIDTGSSNTWVGANQPYTNSSEPVGFTGIEYGSGFFFGEEYLDRFGFSPALSVEKQWIGVADFSEGFEGVDGIFGLGPVDLTKYTVEDADLVPTVMDNLVKEDRIKKEVVGITFHPVNAEDSNGKLTFGGVDDGECTGPITYTPQLSQSVKAGQYWGIHQKLRYGHKDLVKTDGKDSSSGDSSYTSNKDLEGFVDTGTTLCLLRSDLFKQYVNETGATYSPDTGLFKITSEQYYDLKDLVFNIGGTDFPLTPNAQIWPRDLNLAIGGQPDAIYLVVQDLGEPEGIDFINGYTFLERFYSVFDTTDRRVGFANTEYTFCELN